MISFPFCFVQLAWVHLSDQLFYNRLVFYALLNEMFNCVITKPFNWQRVLALQIANVPPINGSLIALLNTYVMKT